MDNHNRTDTNTNQTNPASAVLAAMQARVAERKNPAFKLGSVDAVGFAPVWRAKSSLQDDVTPGFVLGYN